MYLFFDHTNTFKPLIPKDVLANTENSVDRLVELPQETYLCPSTTAYLMPLRDVLNKIKKIIKNIKILHTLYRKKARLVWDDTEKKIFLVFGPLYVVNRKKSKRLYIFFSSY